MSDDKLGDNSATTNWSIYQNFASELGVDYHARVNFTRDTSTTSESSNVKLGVYVSLPGQPKLSQPNPDNNAGAFNHINYMAQNFPDQILSLMNSLPTPENDDFPEDLDEAIAKVGEETLAKIGGGDPKKGALMLKFAAIHPDAKVPADLAALATTVRDQATAAAGHGPSSMLVALEDAAINALADVHFQMTVASSGLSEADQKALCFANEVPSAATLLSPELQAALKSAQSQAATKTEDASGCPPGWISPPDSKAYETEVGNRYATNVTNLISQQLMDGSISKAQYNEMRTLLYFPDADTPNRDTLLPMLNAALGQATEALQQQYGIPSGYSPKIDAAGYTGILNLTFSAGFSALLAKQSPSLTPDQQTLLKGALLSSTAEEALPPDLKAIFAGVKEAAIAKLSSTYGVPLTWTPNAEVLSMAASKSQEPGIIQAQIMLDQGKEWVTHAKEALTLYSAAGGGGGGGGPLEILVKNYLRTVSLALSGMQEMLYELSTTSANMAALMNKVQNDDKIGQLKKQKAELDKMIAQQKKMEALGPLKALFQWIIIAILVMFMGPAGLAIAALLMATMVIQSAQQLSKGKSVLSVISNMDFINSLAETFNQIGNAIGGPGGKAFSSIFKLLTFAVMVFFAPTLLVADLMIGSGSLVKDTAEALGVPKEIAKQGAMIFQMIFQVVVGFLLVAVTCGASIASAFVTFARGCAEAAKTVILWIRNVVWPALQRLGSSLIPTLGMSAKDSGTSGAKLGASLMDKLDKFQDVCDKTITALDKIDDLAKGVETATKTATEATKNVTTKASILESAGKELMSALKSAGKGSYSNVEDALNAAKSLGDDVVDSVKKARDATDNASDALQSAKTLETKAKTDLEIANIAFKEAADSSYQMQMQMANWIDRANTLTSAVQQVAQAIPQIQNSIIRAQITRIKAKLEAEMVTVEQFCKLLIALVKKLMETASGAGEEIKDLSSAQQNLFQSAGSALSNLASSSRG